MRIAFMGTPDFAVPTLDALIGAGHEIPAVYCQPPRPAGRGRAPRRSPVQERAEAAGLAVRTPESLSGAEEQQAFAALDVDFAVVAAYGLILPPPILAAPRQFCVNVHASLLPRWRGAAPIQRAILAGDERTGVTIMRMDEGLDTGPMMAKWPANASGRTAGELSRELAGIGAWMMMAVIDRWPDVGQWPQPQEGVTYAPKVRKAEARLDFSRPAAEAERQVRAFNPVPGAFFDHAGERIKIHAAEVEAAGGEPGTVLDRRLAIACGEGALVPTRVQRPGKAAMATEEMLRGFPIPPGTRLE
jgi:methionyl-tRNA formyltransferase